jgi:hypothetical protein
MDIVRLQTRKELIFHYRVILNFLMYKIFAYGLPPNRSPLSITALPRITLNIGIPTENRKD